MLRLLKVFKGLFGSDVKRKMERLKPSGIVPKKLSEEKVLDSWSVLIESGQGRGTELYNDFLKFLEESNVPEVEAKAVKVVPGWLKGLFGKEREYLMVTTERLKDYKIYVCARDYGKYLDVQWYLTCDPGFFSKAFKIGATIYTAGLSNLILSFDIFDQQDLIAFATSVHHSLLKAVEKLMHSLNQDPSKINRKSRGFLGVS
jgi:hypothetical protein